MKAWRIEKHGGPDVLVRTELADPIPGAMQVRVRVEAVGINHLDVWLRKGVPGHRFPLPMTPGCDISGVIDEFGPGAEAALASSSSLKRGSAVIVNPGLSCGRCEACLGGFDPLCPYYGIIGETCDGGCADYVVVSIANLIARPAEISTVEAAALPIPYLTAWTMLTRKAELRAGETVLIQAGGSAVSVAAIQMAKLLGATVVTTVGSEEKAAKALALGADHVINYKKAPFRDELKKTLASYGKRGCEVILDHVGADTFSESMKALAWGGRLVTCGATSGGEIPLNLRAVFFKNISILGSTMGSKADLIRVVELVKQKKIKAVVDSTLPMGDLAQAMEKLETRKAFGRVVLTQG